MVYITGDTHGNFDNILNFTFKVRTTKNDTVIILGDSGINYFSDDRAIELKEMLSNFPITFFCIHGNHENRASNIPTYKKRQYMGGRVYVEDAYPNLKFAIDGEVYKIPSEKGELNTLVIGGAYSVDKQYRIMMGYNWFEDEQPSDRIKKKVESVVNKAGNSIDVVLSHTCPYKYLPRQWFISGVNQNNVDNSTEHWLDTIEESLINYKKWYCGHFHGEGAIGKLEFMYHSIKCFGD